MSDKRIPTVKWKCRWGWHEGRTLAERAIVAIMSNSHDNDPIGWTVRVTMPDGVVMFYVAGFFMPKDAEAAVQEARRSPVGEFYEAVDPITKAHGPRIDPGEVREASTNI